MREPGFEEFADLWQAPEENEQEVFEALARRARRHGRLLGYADLAFGLVIVAGTVLGIFMTPHPMVIVAAMLLLAATALVTWQRRKLRQMSSTLNTTDRASFLASSIRNANANLRRVNLSIVFAPSGIALAVLFKLNMRDEHFWEHPLADIAGWAMSLRGLFGLSVLAVILLLMTRSRRRIRRELRRLQQLERDYAEERQLEKESFPQEIP